MKDDQGLRRLDSLKEVSDKARAWPAPSPEPWLPAEKGTNGRRASRTYWTMLDRKGADGDGMLWPREVFSFWCLSLLTQDVSSAPQSQPGICPSNTKMLV